ncbi:hypothetical protein MMA231_03462 (plasmid) [Asticcacaulis sp. MM231]|uniref:hypothetical protein n=1 Tax=Asticcacaulis sp. MM231 TaxID=3157666 RepID=UPI0032D59782
MDILVVVPNKEHLKTAGVRIRYVRMQHSLKVLGHTLKIKPIASLIEPDKITEDVILISKVYDVRAMLLMRELKARNKLVGVDFFDNYFTHPDDARLVRIHAWALAVTEIMDFALCATGKMKSILEGGLLNGKPCHILNDPYETFDSQHVTNRLNAKMERLRLTRTLHMAWFGIGQNAYFPVGLADLHAFRDHLSRFRKCGYRVHLTVLSNMSAQSSHMFNMLSQLSIPFSVEEWSEDTEQALIERCLLCFLPVSAQPFSTVKSLNRAISAFCHGAQVLSVGFPLYAPLAPFIYRSADAFLSDLEADNLALQPNTVKQMASQLELLGNPAKEAEALFTFLNAIRSGLARAPKIRQETLAVVQGRQAPDDIRKYVQALEHLVVATPFSPGTSIYDVRISLDLAEHSEPIIILSGNAEKNLLPTYKDKLQVLSAVYGANFRFLPLSIVSKDRVNKWLLGIRNDNRANAFVTYNLAMEAMANILEQLFGEIGIYFSEWEAPFRVERASDYTRPNRYLSPLKPKTVGKSNSTRARTTKVSKINITDA